VTPTNPTYIEDVFSTYLYTGNSSTQTITNGIDLSGNGGLVWLKARSGAFQHGLFDTVRGASYGLVSNNSNEQYVYSSLTGFNTNGFALGSDYNASGTTYASWTFREQPKFFDVVTYTGNGVFGREISHNLGSVPAVIIIKATSIVKDWIVYTTAVDGSQDYLFLNTTAAKADSSITTPWTSTTFPVGGSDFDNGNGVTYVAYLFASNAGGFGLTGTDNVISCGSFTTDGSGNATVNLGYEPQWVLMKPATTSASGNWIIADTMRGWTVDGAGGNANQQLYANSSSAESGGTPANLTSTGFNFTTGYGPWASQTWIYIAIRRGPMKVPTDATSVYQANTYTGNATANTTVAGNFGFPVDLMFLSSRSANATNWSAYGQIFTDRLRGSNVTLGTTINGGEAGGWSTYQSFAVQNSIGWGLYGADSGTGYFNNSGGTWVARGFRRAPGFFDEVCYSGTGIAGQTFNHNLGVVPELMILKGRNSAQAWPVYVSSLGASNSVILSTTAAVVSSSSFNSTAPTASVFSVGSGAQTNGSGAPYVAWLFATLAGVSKVGSYTGNGTTQTINCGFTGGARFVLIKRTDSTGDWYVYDTARGMTVLTDPYLLMNSTAAEVATLGSVTTVSTGFALNSTILAAINVNGGTYIFLAIA